MRHPLKERTMTVREKPRILPRTSIRWPKRSRIGLFPAATNLSASGRAIASTSASRPPRQQIILDYLLGDFQILAAFGGNKGVVGIIGQGQFDSEVFIEIVERINAILSQIGPRRLADKIRSLIHPEPCEARRPPIIDQWEAMPATTRVKVERMLQAISPLSLVRLLDNVADLLERERPAGKQGAPRSISQVFVSRVATIWRTLGLNPGLAYNFFLHPATDDRIGRGGRVASTFQRYCRAALTAVGDFAEISARQVSNYKRSKGYSCDRIR
jgi:hypothetical protein